MCKRHTPENDKFEEEQPPNKKQRLRCDFMKLAMDKLVEKHDCTFENIRLMFDNPYCYNFGYERAECFALMQKFNNFKPNETLIGFYSFTLMNGWNGNGLQHRVYYTNFGNILYIFDINVEVRVIGQRVKIAKLDFEIPTIFINLVNTVVLNKNDDDDKGKPNMSFNNLVSFFMEVKEINTL